MGFLQSLMIRILGHKNEEDEESERPIYPCTTLHHRNGDSERLPKRSTYRRLIFRVLQKVRSVFQRLSPRKTADPILPIQNPVPTTDNDPSLIQSLLISNTDDQELPPYNFDISVEEIAQQNVDSFVEGGEKEEEKMMIKSDIVVHIDEGKWIKHYSSRHRILLVGDGDFSFSTSLAIAFGCASNMIATTLDSKAFLKKHYQNARANMEELRNRSCKVLHGVDATKMTSHALLRHLTFDRIIFNFPFAGFFKNLSRDSQLKRHRRLVSLFMKNAKEMISENGEIHISHKTNEFHIEWKLEMVASSHRLRLIEAVDFNQLDYPGYNTKCGFGGDNNFNCYPSKTYKFGHKRGVGCL